MRTLIIGIFLVLTVQLMGQTIAIKAGSFLDVKNETILKDVVIVIYQDKIIEINSENHIPDSAEVIDLEDYMVLPGLIDAHTHIMSAGGDYEKDLYSYSSVYRAIRATSHLTTSLLNGFTTLRDVGTEGTGFSDKDLSRCIEKGFIDGPRIIPSTLGIAITGYYYPITLNQNWEYDLPNGVQFVSGVEQCMEAVRYQISEGALWIKAYIDWQTPNGTKVIISSEELSAIVNTANALGIQVAAHATTKEGIELCLNSGVRSIEHGNAFIPELIEKALVKNVYWCPTISVFEYYKMDNIKAVYANLKDGYAKGMKIVLGTDAGSFPWTINQAKELEYYVKNAGFKPIDAIKTGTIHAAELLNMEKEIGQIQPGYYADIIAVKGNPMEDICILQNVVFVMKNGKVYKRPE